MADDNAKSVTLMGAGLVGSLLAVYLARRGYRVRVYERRPDMRKQVVDAGRSINLAISARGLHALAQVGLEKEALAHAIPMRGRMMHAVNGELSFQAYGKDDSQHINSISRGWLNQRLMTAAEETGRVEIFFGRRVTRVDLDAGRMTVREDRSGQETQVEAPVLLGTDGSASALRQALAARPRFAAEQSVLGHGYKELEIPPGAKGSFQLEKNALHIWPRGEFMFIALPNENGSFTCTLFLPFEGKNSFAALATPPAVRAFFEQQFPDAVPLMPRLEEDFFENPTGQMVTVKASPWHLGDRALLLGDAAHAMVPFYGQGMNAGFEDCAVFDELLEQFPDDRAQLFARFDEARKTNADAISDMAVENFVEMRDKVGDAHFLLEKAVEKKLLNAFPREFLSRYSLVSFSLEPYRFAYQVGERAQEIVAELARGVSRAEDVDLSLAHQLIETKLTPFIEASKRGAPPRG